MTKHYARLVYGNYYELKLCCYQFSLIVRLLILSYLWNDYWSVMVVNTGGWLEEE